MNLQTAFYRVKHRAIVRAGIELRKISALIRKDEYDKIAAELQDLLIRNWDEATTQAIRNVISAIKGEAEFTRRELDQMIAALRGMLGQSFAGSVAPELFSFQKEAYTQALGAAAGVALEPTLNFVDRKALAALERHALYPVRHYYDDHLEDKIRRFGSKIITEGLDQTAAGKLLENEFAKKYNTESFRYWEAYANHITTRAREFGAVESYVRAGLEYVEVRAVLDANTTQICRHMHGRIIKVSELVEIRARIMANEDPDKVAQVTPWPKADELAETPSGALPDGAKMPGYHFGCRTRTRPLRRVAERNVVTEMEMGRGVTKKDRKRLEKLSGRSTATGWRRSAAGVQSHSTRRT